MREVLSCRPAERWPELTIDLDAPSVVLARQIVTAYLSRQHLEDREGTCPLVALPSDVARGGEPVRRAYRQVLESMIGHLEKGLYAQGPGARTQALAIASLCIGGMVVARTVDDPDLAQEIREAAKALALSCGGWDVLLAAAE